MYNRNLFVEIKLCCVIAVCILTAVNVKAQLQVTAGTHWVCDSSSHTYVVLNNTGIRYSGIQELIGSVFRFTGAAHASIDGASTASFNIIEIAKTGIGKITLGRNINVLNKVRFENGILDLDAHVLNLINDALLEGEAANARCIGNSGGYVQATAILKAPVKNNPGNLGAVIVSPDALGETVVRRGHVSQQNNNGGGSSVLRYYDILPQQNTRLSASLQFNYLDEELNGINEGRMVLMKRETDTGPWENMGADERDITQNYIIKKNITSFSRWTLSGIDNALPVIWRSFTVTCSGSAVVISWSTETEINTKDFIVQRSINGANDWENIFVQPASGNSAAPQAYHYTDASTSPGNLYYRIMQTDADGRFSYSPVVHAVCSSVEEVMIYPNPVTDVIWVSVNNIRRNQKVELVLRNTTGAIVLGKQLSIENGRSLLQLPVTGLAQGTYTLSVTLDKLMKSFKIVKQ